MKSIEPEDDDSTVFDNAALACILDSEIEAVLAVLRVNLKWEGQYISGDDQLEHSLIKSLKALQKQIYGWKHPWHTINPVVYLQPFLDVIRSDETDASIIVVALSSIYKVLTPEVLDLNPKNVQEAMLLVVDAVTNCRIEVTDPASEQVGLVNIFQILLTCMKSKTSFVPSNEQVCNIAKLCSRVFNQAGTKGEWLRQIAQQTMLELVKRVFLYLSAVNNSEISSVKGATPNKEALENRNDSSENDSPKNYASSSSTVLATRVIDELTDQSSIGKSVGVSCMIEIFRVLLNLLNSAGHARLGPGSSTLPLEEDKPLFALTLINSTVELGGPSIRKHPQLLSLVRDELFYNLMQFGMSTSPLILSMVCCIVLNLYHHLRSELKLQIEAFFSCVILRLAQSRYVSYAQQEVVMEALVHFGEEKNFMVEMYINLDCDITCCNVFEHLAKLIARSACPLKCSLSSMNLVALRGLLSVIHEMAERIRNGSADFEVGPVSSLEKYSPFWLAKCDSYTEPDQWVPFVRRRKYIKSMLMIGADRFNRNPKEGLKYLQETHILPDNFDPQSVACFLRYAAGLNKYHIGDFLGYDDKFAMQVLDEFAGTFDFQGMNFDIALRLFLDTFTLPREEKLMQRVLTAFSERYYKQCSETVANKYAAVALTCSALWLNARQHNPEVINKMTVDDFIQTCIKGGHDLSRELLSEVYSCICENEIVMTLKQAMGFPEMTRSRWVDLMNRSRKTPEFIVSNSNNYVDYDMFVIMAEPAIFAILLVFEHAKHEEVYKDCIEGFLDIAKILSCYHLEDVLDYLVVSLCKFTTLLNQSFMEEVMEEEKPGSAFGDDMKARSATLTVFKIASMYGDFIRTGWRSIINCVLKLRKLDNLVLARVAADDTEVSSEPGQGKSLTNSLSFSNLLSSAGTTSLGLKELPSQILSLDTEKPTLQPTDPQHTPHQSTLQTIKDCHIDDITKRKFNQDDSLIQLARALIQNGATEDEEETAAFCLDMLIALTLNNRDRIEKLWQGVSEYITNIFVQSTTVIPCALVKEAVSGLVRICQSLLPDKEELADELLGLVLKLDADAYCELIIHEVSCFVKTNASDIRSHLGWRTITSLLSITARHPVASEAGFDVLFSIMSKGAHILPANFAHCVDLGRQFAESRVGQVDRCLESLDLMAGSVFSLIRWAQRVNKTRVCVGKKAESMTTIGEMWLSLVQALRKVCFDHREDVRNHALSVLQKCLSCWDKIQLPEECWLQCFDLVIFALVDRFLEIAGGQSRKDYNNIEGTLSLALKLLLEVFLQLIDDLSQSTSFGKLWLGVLGRMEKYMMVKTRERKLHEDLLKKTLIVMKSRGVLVQRSHLAGASLLELTWFRVNIISPDLHSEVFSG